MEPDLDVAIVGLACRFPGAKDAAEFWRNLTAGVESIARLSEPELIAAGVSPQTFQRSDYVKAAPVLDDPALFDAAFFGYSPGEAASVDPQHRLLLELSQLALEDAGCDPESFPGRIGVFAGSAMNTYFGDRGMTDRLAEAYIPTLVAADKDFLATRISYKLGLRGPSLTVQTACSTSLVAIHLARQSLLSEETDVALAGAVSVRVPHRAGYFYEGSGVVSPDGRVRAFDAGANGTVFGSGAGIVVLKRLADAVAQGDEIYAVIKGSAVNNDGSGKAGYTAPSVSGQADVIVEALANAGVGAEEISYIEAHGSGTPVGDRIELLALNSAFRHFTARTGFCAIGSVKTNVGHLDAAAGMAGLIKTALALRHGRIPATLNYTQPNPEIDFPATAFVVNGALREWPRGSLPRRAGILATGMGGTNAAVILEEAPAAAPAEAAAGPQLLVWSAKTPTALETMTAGLAAGLTGSLAAAAWTLQTGRKHFAERRFLVARDLEDARRELADAKSSRVTAGSPREAAELPVILLLPGMGDQYVGMGRGLYDRFAVYRTEIDRCAEILLPLIGADIREILCPAGAAATSPAKPAGIDLKRMLGRGPEEVRSLAESRLDETLFNQPVLFAVEYAMARLWMDWGVQPARLVGHSMGEYVAACLAGVFSLEDALRMVVARAKLVQDLPGGAMVAVMLSESELLPLLSPELSIALINGPRLCVVAGPVPAMDAFQAKLKARQVIFRPVRNTHAFHSRLLDAVVEPFIAALRGVVFSPPQIPFISNVTGSWIAPEQAVDPRYWADHARKTARFSDALGHLAKLPGTALLEVGPGRTLGVLAAQHPAWPLSNKPLVVSSMRQSYENYFDVEVILAAAGRLWLQGARLNWERMGLTEGAGKARLPGYPFERVRCWLERSDSRPAGGRRAGGRSAASGLDDWFYVPSWQRAGLVEREDAPPVPGLWLVIADQPTVEWTVRLRQGGAQVAAAVLGLDVRRRELADYLQLVGSLAGRLDGGLNVVHAVNHAEDGFHSLLRLAQAIAEKIPTVPVRLAVLTAGVHDVTGGERLVPDGALAVGLSGVIGRELPNVTAFAIDRSSDSADCSMALREFAAPVAGAVLAYRGRYRWRRSFEPHPLPATHSSAPALRQKGVYLITGGTGGIGLAIAQYLASACQARLVLVSRNPPPGDAGAALEAAGREVLVQRADVADPAAVERVIAATLARFGAIHGVIHAAGILQDGVLQLKTPAAVEAVLHPKVAGTRVLYEAVKDLPLDFLALFSSLSSVVPRHGQGDYCAANSFLDAFAAFAAGDRRFRTVAINWPAWRDVGIMKNRRALAGLESRAQRARDHAIGTADGLEAFRRAVSSGYTQLAVSSQALTELEGEAAEAAEVPAVVTAVPPARRVAEPPEDEVEKSVAEIWSGTLGLAPLGRHENFLELGGHSLLAMRIVAQIRTTYQINYTLRKFFENPTVALSAAAIQAEIVAEIEALPDDEVAAKVP